jgi:hypothetical protein
MNRKRRILVFVFLVLFLSGCATWQLVKAPKTHWRYSYFSAELPAGWVKYREPKHLLFLTRDGILLQRITLKRHPIKKEFAVSKRKIKEGMLIQEIAELIIDEISLNKEFLNFELLENKPVDVGGVAGFRLTYTFNNSDFTKYKRIVYGFVIKNMYYELEYLAARQHYFDKSVEDFQRFFQSFKIDTQRI